MNTYWVALQKIATSSTNLWILRTRIPIFNIHDFSQLLKHYYFEVLVDHKATKSLQKGKKETTTNRRKVLVLKL